MTLNVRNVAQHELIGLEIEIVEANNKNLKGIKGKVIDETRETIVVSKNKEKPKRLMKNQITFKTKIDDEEIIIDGKILVKRPEERIKKLKGLK